MLTGHGSADGIFTDFNLALPTSVSMNVLRLTTTQS